MQFLTPSGQLPVASRVLTTSMGVMTKLEVDPATAPAKKVPAALSFCCCAVDPSFPPLFAAHLRLSSSYKTKRMVADGMLRRRVAPYPAYRPEIPFSLTMLITVVFAPCLIWSCCLMTSFGTKTNEDMTLPLAAANP